MHPVEAMLDRALQDGGPELVLREVGVEQQPVVTDLMPLAALAALAHAFVETRTRKGIGDRVAHVIQREAAGEVDAADQGVSRLAQIADHEEAGRFAARRDTGVYRGAGLVRRDAFL